MYCCGVSAHAHTCCDMLKVSDVMYDCDGFVERHALKHAALEYQSVYSGQISQVHCMYRHGFWRDSSRNDIHSTW